MLTLARSCRLAVADIKLVDMAGRCLLMVKRFDRAKTMMEARWRPLAQTAGHAGLDGSRSHWMGAAIIAS